VCVCVCVCHVAALEYSTLLGHLRVHYHVDIKYACDSMAVTLLKFSKDVDSFGGFAKLFFTPGQEWGNRHDMMRK